MKKMFKVLVLMVMVSFMVYGGTAMAFERCDGVQSTTDITRINDSFNRNGLLSGNTRSFNNNLNDNQVGLINQDGNGNQTGITNVQGNGNVIGGSGQYEGGDAQAQKQTQGQAQGQLQGQLQGQQQSANNNQQQSVNNNQQQSANNEGVNNTLKLTQTYEDKRDHIEGPAMLKSDAKFSGSKTFIAKSKGSIWDKVFGMSVKQAKFINKTTDDDDIDIKQAALFEMKYRTKYIYKGKSGVFMGYLTLTPDGSDASTGGMEAQAVIAACQLGATHMDRIFFGTGEVSGGDAWNVGLGGGASIMRSGDDVAIAPNGGLGYGEAKAINTQLSEMVFELYLDKDSINWEKSEYKGQTGNHTKYGSQKFDD